MTRRELIALLASTAAVSWRGVARASMRMIGFMGPGAGAAQRRWTALVMERLRELGWAEGRNVAIEYRWADGRSERFAESAAEFVRQNVDLILTHNPLPTLAAKQATSTIPIVFATVGDPVGNGLVASLAHPGGNITGLSAQTADAAGKRLELLREIIPSLRRLAVMGDANSPVSKSDVREVEEAARNAAVELIAIDVSQEGDVERAIEAVKGRAQALYVTPSPPSSSIATASTRSLSRPDCPPCTARGNMSRRQV